MILPARILWGCMVESMFIKSGLSNNAIVDDVVIFGLGLLVLVVFGVLGVIWFLVMAANSCSTGSDSSGTVSKLASDVSVSVQGSEVGICGSDSIDSGVGDHGLVVAGVLHKCLKLNASNGRCSIVGSPPMRLQLSGSCSSLELPGERNVLPHCVVMFHSSGFLHPEMEQGFSS